MAADVGGGVGLDDHRHGVPADVALDPALHLPVAGERRLLLRRNRVDVRRVEAARQPVLRGAQTVGELVQQLRRAFRPLVFQGQIKNGLQRLRPLVARTVNFFFLHVCYFCVIRYFSNFTKKAR